MSKSIKRLVLLSLLTTMALTIFVIEAQIPVPIAIPGVKLGLANVITLIVLVEYHPRDAFLVLVLRILLGSFFAGQITTLMYSLSGGVLCFFGMAFLCKLLQKKHLWFVSMIGAVLHNIGQLLAAMVMMQSAQVWVYLPFLMITGCITGLFTGFVATQIVKHWPNRAAISLEEKDTKNN